MNGIRTIRPSRRETDLDALTRHLCEVLLRFRNRKTARDLVGNDERSDTFGVDDLDVFADAPVAGTGLTVIDRMKVRARAQRLVDARLRAAGANGRKAERRGTMAEPHAVPARAPQQAPPSPGFRPATVEVTVLDLPAAFDTKAVEKWLTAFLERLRASTRQMRLDGRKAVEMLTRLGKELDWMPEDADDAFAMLERRPSAGSASRGRTPGASSNAARAHADRRNAPVQRRDRAA